MEDWTAVARRMSLQTERVLTMSLSAGLAARLYHRRTIERSFVMLGIVSAILKDRESMEDGEAGPVEATDPLAGSDEVLGVGRGTNPG